MKSPVKNLIHVVTIVFALLGGAVISHATLIMPTSYDMLNGYGQASGGYLNYWDVNYTPSSGNNTIDGAPLSGGLGKLTDRTIAPESWLSTENAQGTGYYVGWLIDPTITFHFGSLVSIDNISFYVDNPVNDIYKNPLGGVAAPKGFTIGGNEYSSGFNSALNNIEGTGPVAINIPTLGLDSIKDLTVTIHRDTYGVVNDLPIRFWLMLSEVTFDDGFNPVPVPEPSTLILIGSGIAGFALMRNRRKV